MKTLIKSIALFALLTGGQAFAQDVTTVRANNRDISDNLDLKAVASIFGDSKDLEDFERRLNDPDIQISNLDLNGDNRVDYIRVIESTEGNTHLIILQSVIGADTFQDVATIEVERDRNNNVQVQVVGDVYMYGTNYIYEPVYVSRPIIYDVFWVNAYRPYYSPWYWGYYPTYYTYWSPYPIYRYRNNIHIHINGRNSYNYVNVRRSSRAVAMYSSRRSNAYERQNPNRSFAQRTNVSNRQALEQSRTATRSQALSTRGTGTTRAEATQTSLRSTGTREATQGSLRATGTRDISTRANTNVVRNNNANEVRSNGSLRDNSFPTRSSNTPARVNTGSNEVRQPSVITRGNTDNNNVIRTNPGSTRSSEPRLNSTPARNSGLERNNTPAVRNTPAPQVRSNPAPQMRSNPAPQMRSNPAPRMESSPSRGGNGGGGGRRG